MNLKRKGDDDTPVRRSERLVYQKESDVGYLIGDTVKTKAQVNPSRKLVYQKDPDDDDDFVDEPSKLKCFGSKFGEKKEAKVKKNKGKGKDTVVKKADYNLEEMDRVLIRISPISLFRVISNLTEQQRKSVREMGFGGILEYRISEIPTRLGYWVLDKFDEDSCSLVFGSNTIPITREDVNEVLGIPMGSIHVDAIKGTSRSDKLTKSWKMLFGGNIGKIYHSNVEDLIQSQQEGGWMFKITFLVIFFTAMGQTSKFSTPNLKFLPCILGEGHIIHLDWCTYMIECLVNTKRSWVRSTHYTGPLVMLLILYANSTKSITQNVARTTPAIAFWTSSLLNKREMEEIASGGFGMHEVNEKQGRGDNEKQESVVAEKPSTQICVKLNTNEAGVEDDGYMPYATQTLIDELSTPHLLDGDEGLYPVLEDGMFSKYGTERPPQNLKEVKKYVAFKLEMANMYRHEADICLKDAIKDNPEDVDLKGLLKLRNEMCDILESNEFKDTKDNMGRTKEATNANGTPTQLIKLSDHVLRSRQSCTQLKMVGRGMIYDGPSFDLNLTQSPTPNGKVSAGPKYDEELDEPQKIINELQNFDLQPKATSESSDFKTPVSKLASVTGSDSSSSSGLRVKNREPKPLHVIIPANCGDNGKGILYEALESPYTRKECSVEDYITYPEKWVADCIFSGRFPPTDILFQSNTVTHSLEVQRSVFESLYEGICIASGVIDVFSHVLNYGEKFRDRKSVTRVFCNTSMVTEKMLCDDWDAEYTSKLFIQNMRNVLRSTVHQRLEKVDLVFFPVIKGEHFYVICMDLKKTEIHILDNINSDEEDLVKRYGQMPRVLTKLFEDYLAFEKHHREGRMKFAGYKILKMRCRTMRNFVDCGVFAMRHMETYKGEGHFGNICGLRTEGKAQNFLLNDLRNKYVAKMLLCEINMKKKEVQSETEAYKRLSIGERLRLSEDALETLMQRVDDMF